MAQFRSKRGSEKRQVPAGMARDLFAGLQLAIRPSSDTFQEINYFSSWQSIRQRDSRRGSEQSPSSLTLRSFPVFWKQTVFSPAHQMPLCTCKQSCKGQFPGTAGPGGDSAVLPWPLPSPGFQTDPSPCPHPHPTSQGEAKAKQAHKLSCPCLLSALAFSAEGRRTGEI